jgi:hypothetical protein
MRTTKDDPLLAYWQYGLGTTMAFTSDAQPKWARRWMEWPDFNAFWAQAIRATMRQTSAQNIQMSVSSSGGHADLDVSAFDPFGAPINGMQAQVSVIGPDNRPQALTLSQSGPGHYQAQFDASQTGAYLITAAQPAATADGKPSITRTGFSVAYPPEFQATGPNISLLEQIAKTTGGKILDHPAAAFRPADRPGESVSDLWPTLLLAAAILFVLDIAVRRLAIPLPEIPLLGRRMPARQSRGGDGAKRAIPSSPKESAAEPRTARGNGVAPVDIEDERPPADSRRRKPDSRALSTANRLLDVKRKGRRPDGD